MSAPDLREHPRDQLLRARVVDELGLELGEDLRVALGRHVVLRDLWVMRGERRLAQLLRQLGELGRALPRREGEQVAGIKSMTALLVRERGVQIDRRHARPPCRIARVRAAISCIQRLGTTRPFGSARLLAGAMLLTGRLRAAPPCEPARIHLRRYFELDVRPVLSARTHWGPPRSAPLSRSASCSSRTPSMPSSECPWNSSKVTLASVRLVRLLPAMSSTCTSGRHGVPSLWMRTSTDTDWIVPYPVLPRAAERLQEAGLHAYTEWRLGHGTHEELMHP